MIEKLIEQAKEQATWDIPEGTQQLLLQLAELAKRQQAEIDRLKMLFNDQQEIIADLEWTVENEGFKHLGKMYSELRAEAIKEFAKEFDDILAEMREAYFEDDHVGYGLVCETVRARLAMLTKKKVGADDGKL